METLFAKQFSGRRVLVTGHTGFKGSWLSTWLLLLGAEVIGFSLAEPPTKPSNFVVSRLHEHLHDVRGDINDTRLLIQTIEHYKPEVVFHLAAQPIVLRSMEQPKLTFDTNASGTVNVLEAMRKTNSVRALVSITTDKVYANREWWWGYRENDQLGSDDPYSASKAMAELAIASYRTSFFPAEKYEQHGVAIASVRAGNVIGGGDFADYRLVPDCMKALMAGEPIQIRNPGYIRPWQHVLEPLSGYLWLAARLLREGPALGEAWNFGPTDLAGITTQAIAEKLITMWGSGSWVHVNPYTGKEEMQRLRLNCDKTIMRLGWRPVYTWDETLAEIVAWFKAFQAQEDMYAVAREHLAHYVAQAQERGLPWA